MRVFIFIFEREREEKVVFFFKDLGSIMNC